MRAIEHFRYCPRCGKSTIASDTGKSVQCWLCGFLLFSNVAAAVGAIIPDQRGRVLFVRRARDPRKGKLAAPGGFVDAGESVESALAREVKEETNLDIVSANYLTSSSNNYHYCAVTYPTTDLYFVCKVRSFSTLAALDETESVALLSLDEIEQDQIAFFSLWQALEVFKSLQDTHVAKARSAHTMGRGAKTLDPTIARKSGQSHRGRRGH